MDTSPPDAVHPSLGAAGGDHPPDQSWYRIWLPRIAMGTLLVIALLYGSVWIVGSTSDFIVVLVVSIFVAFALLPAVEVLSRRGWRRGPATAVVMFGGALLGLGFVVAVTQVIVGETIAFIDNAPQYLTELQGWLNDTFGWQVDFNQAIEQLTADRDRLQRVAQDAMGGILGLATTAVGLVFQALMIGLFVFYILADLPKLRAAVLRRFPPTQQLHIDTVTGITIEKVGGYVYSRLLLALVSAAFHMAAFLLIGLPYVVALGLWVGFVSQFIPTVGTYLAGALPVLIALAEGEPIQAVWVVVAIIIYQSFENYVLSPRITANTMDLHPAVAFASVIIGGSLLGGVGALLALPTAATLVALIGTYTDHYEITSGGPIETPEAYETRLRARAEEKTRKKTARKGKLSTLVKPLSSTPEPDAEP